MNLQQIKTLVAIMEEGSFSAAAERLGLSHPAISLQIRHLEQEFNRPIFDRSTRPPTFTETGLRAAEAARQSLETIANITLIGSGKHHTDTLTVGAVPTVLQDSLPVILRKIQLKQPNLQVKVRSGLSSDLTSQVLNREIDVALVTGPIAQFPELDIVPLAKEPLFVIANKDMQGLSEIDLLQSQTFIAFSYKTLLGQQISQQLRKRNIFVKESMEVDSVAAIESFVREGFGVSIVPQRYLAPELSDYLTLVPFCEPQDYRQLVAVSLKDRYLTNGIPIIHRVISDLRKASRR